MGDIPGWAALMGCLGWHFPDALLLVLTAGTAQLERRSFLSNGCGERSVYDVPSPPLLLTDLPCEECAWIGRVVGARPWAAWTAHPLRK